MSPCARLVTVVLLLLSSLSSLSEAAVEREPDFVVVAVVVVVAVEKKDELIRLVNNGDCGKSADLWFGGTSEEEVKAGNFVQAESVE